MSRGWSINLSQGGFDQEIDVPVLPLFTTSEGPVVELVVWSCRWSKWVHLVSAHFPQPWLPPGHIQLDLIELSKLPGGLRGA